MGVLKNHTVGAILFAAARPVGSQFLGRMLEGSPNSTNIS